jgi:hypothetical protein
MQDRMEVAELREVLDRCRKMYTHCWSIPVQPGEAKHGDQLMCNANC